MKPLPIGISTFRLLIEEELVYVDKTGLIDSLVQTPGRYFLSRPRRFGKSLLIDTFKELFEGNKPLFHDLVIYDRWDWSKKYPVIKLDFAGGVLRNRQDMENKLYSVFNRLAEEQNISLTAQGLSNCFQELIYKFHKKSSMPVVLLVDEYDKPMLDNIEDPEINILMRDLLKDLYSTIKEMDSMLHFVFLTGVSKFSKVNIFSGINNLKDLTLDPNYATLCGYTQNDLETLFADHLEGVDRAQLKLWYNGYNFLGDPVYNPFDVLLFISENKTFRNFWFETGTPSFLVKLMQKNHYFLPDLENIEAGEELLSSFEPETLQPVTLLFQTGYLSIKGTEFRRSRTIFRLGFPNLEVKLAFTDYLITSYTHAAQEKVKLSDSAWDALRTGNLPALESTLRRLFAGIPWCNFTNNDIADYEGYYASVLYAYFSAVTGTVIPEDTTNHGQADITVRLENYIYVMEIKVISSDLPADSSNSALEQIQKRNYAEKYRKEPGVQVFEVGMIFSQEKRNLIRFDFTGGT